MGEGQGEAKFKSVPTPYQLRTKSTRLIADSGLEKTAFRTANFAIGSLSLSKRKNH